MPGLGSDDAINFYFGVPLPAFHGILRHWSEIAVNN
jgi:hypothetical protein